VEEWKQRRVPFRSHVGKTLLQPSDVVATRRKDLLYIMSVLWYEYGRYDTRNEKGWVIVCMHHVASNESVVRVRTTLATNVQKKRIYIRRVISKRTSVRAWWCVRALI
jgi:hypothetical protein